MRFSSGPSHLTLLSSDGRPHPQDSSSKSPTFPPSNSPSSSTFHFPPSTVGSPIPQASLCSHLLLKPFHRPTVSLSWKVTRVCIPYFSRPSLRRLQSEGHPRHGCLQHFLWPTDSIYHGRANCYFPEDPQLTSVLRAKNLEIRSPDFLLDPLASNDPP